MPIAGPCLETDWREYETEEACSAFHKRLSYYREGLNAAEAEIASQEVLSFFKVFEMRREGSEVRRWIAEEFDRACKNV